MLWGADLLARKARSGRIEWRNLLIPLMPGAVILAVMVMLGRDLGTTLVLMLIFLALLWVVGAPLKLFGGILAVAVLAVIVMISTERYRIRADRGLPGPVGRRPARRASRRCRGRSPWAAAAGSGSVWAPAGRSGAGCPHAETDFIFAIIGEELGLIGHAGRARPVRPARLRGAAGGHAGSRTRSSGSPRPPRSPGSPARRSSTSARSSACCPSPVSRCRWCPTVDRPCYPTLAALGMLLSFAKREPGAREALAARGPGPVARGLSWLGLGGPALKRWPARGKR